MFKSFVLVAFLLLASCSTPIQRKPSSINSVLYIGDSQSEGHLGGIVYKYLNEKSQKYQISLYGVGSSSPRHWANNRKYKNSKWLCNRNARYNDKKGVSMAKTACQGKINLSVFEYLNEDEPEFVIFQFLGNSMGFDESYINKKVKRLLGSLSKDQECLFITSPPYFKSLVKRNIKRAKTQDHFISAIGNRCKIIKGVNKQSLKVFASQRDNYSGDKMHLSKKGAERFFNSFKSSLP